MVKHNVTQIARLMYNRHNQHVAPPEEDLIPIQDDPTVEDENAPTQLAPAPPASPQVVVPEPPVDESTVGIHDVNGEQILNISMITWSITPFSIRGSVNCAMVN